ncbi:hypothetical protein LDG_7734 [Legionella drancourtii LLAP12]|uniref:Uncharacterized protein n=1 Tax=Legionella drancourtii LLAP12 TaxID=658187 RepID=G9ER25_9GAMM|nr:hypothetical protein LDG_7734 [Legionella drancourtii LLAP12]
MEPFFVHYSVGLKITIFASLRGRVDKVTKLLFQIFPNKMSCI